MAKNIKIGDQFENYKVIGIKEFDDETFVYLKEVKEYGKKKSTKSD